MTGRRQEMQWSYDCWTSASHGCALGLDVLPMCCKHGVLQHSTRGHSGGNLCRLDKIASAVTTPAMRITSASRCLFVCPTPTYSESINVQLLTIFAVLLFWCMRPTAVQERTSTPSSNATQWLGPSPAHGPLQTSEVDVSTCNTS